MRLIRGVKALTDYLKSIDCDISESTIYRLIKQNNIPFKRPAPGILIFDLNAIDKWLSYEDVESI
ncbi:helix-turn-helix transcriptional regulator [Virgibacillus sp. W0430]|uniref:helix-turn-helix transcriptional regulator n=1 Tax=Virgibacillus sp. W0430 TaxID=3391580 RepID=UPI003F44D9FD